MPRRFICKATFAGATFRFGNFLKVAKSIPRGMSRLRRVIQIWQLFKSCQIYISWHVAFMACHSAFATFQTLPNLTLERMSRLRRNIQIWQLFKSCQIYISWHVAPICIAFSLITLKKLPVLYFPMVIFNYSLRCLCAYKLVVMAGGRAAV